LRRGDEALLFFMQIYRSIRNAPDNSYAILDHMSWEKSRRTGGKSMVLTKSAKTMKNSLD
jgi:hypothetical protein